MKVNLEEISITTAEQNELYSRCLRCGRKLKNDDAKKIGYGKICLDKIKFVRNNTLLDLQNCL